MHVQGNSSSGDTVVCSGTACSHSLRCMQSTGYPPQSLPRLTTIAIVIFARRRRQPITQSIIPTGPSSSLPPVWSPPRKKGPTSRLFQLPSLCPPSLAAHRRSPHSSVVPQPPGAEQRADQKKAGQVQPSWPSFFLPPPPPERPFQSPLSSPFCAEPSPHLSESACPAA